MTEAAQLAAHEQKIVDLLAEARDLNSFVATASLALSAFRHARAGVAADPQSAPAYRIMARSAHHLFRSRPTSRERSTRRTARTSGSITLCMRITMPCRSIRILRRTTKAWRCCKWPAASSIWLCNIFSRSTG